MADHAERVAESVRVLAAAVHAGLSGLAAKHQDRLADRLRVALRPVCGYCGGARVVGTAAAGLPKEWRACPRCSDGAALPAPPQEPGDGREPTVADAIRWTARRTEDRSRFRGPLCGHFVPPVDPKMREDEYHVLRLLGNGQVSASKARELIDAIRDGLEPELMPYEVDGGTPLPDAAPPAPQGDGSDADEERLSVRHAERGVCAAERTTWLVYDAEDGGIAACWREDKAKAIASALRESEEGDAELSGESIMLIREHLAGVGIEAAFADDAAARAAAEIKKLRAELAAARQQETEPQTAAHVVGKKREGGGRDEPLHYYLCGPRRETEAEALADLARWEGGQPVAKPVAWRWHGKNSPASAWLMGSSVPAYAESGEYVVEPLYAAPPPAAAPPDALRRAAKALLEHPTPAMKDGQCTSCGAMRGHDHHPDCRWQALRAAALDAAPPVAPDDNELPGMWSHADLSGGLADALDAASPGEPVQCEVCGHRNGTEVTEAENIYMLARAVYDQPVLLRRLQRVFPQDEVEGAAPPPEGEQPFRVVLEDGWARVKAWTGESMGGFDHEPDAQESARLLNRLFGARPYAAHPPAMSEPWPIRDAVATLAEAAHHFSSEHDCDHHGYEEVMAAAAAAEEWLTGQLPAAEEELRSLGSQIDWTPDLPLGIAEFALHRMANLEAEVERLEAAAHPSAVSEEVRELKEVAKAVDQWLRRHEPLGPEPAALARRLARAIAALDRKAGQQGGEAQR